VVVEATAVSPEGRISPADLGLWDDGQVEAFSRLTDAIHRSGAKAAVQLAHAGRKASTAVPWIGAGAVSDADGGWDPVAPSALSFDASYRPPLALDSGGVERLRGAFVAAARRAVRAGFDAVELHAAHGYLIHQFLSPLTNRRTDAYGGDAAGRFRFFLELIDAVRFAIPEGMPLLARVSATDWIEGGWDVDECARVLRLAAEEGLDFVDVSSGGIDPSATMRIGAGYQVGFASRIRAETGLPVGAVGLITSAEQIDQILISGSADAVSLGRLLLRDPYWPSRNLPQESRRVPPQYLRAY